MFVHWQYSTSTEVFDCCGWAHCIRWAVNRFQPLPFSRRVVASLFVTMFFVQMVGNPVNCSAPLRPDQNELSASPVAQHPDPAAQQEPLAAAISCSDRARLASVSNLRERRLQVPRGLPLFLRLFAVRQVAAARQRPLAFDGLPHLQRLALPVYRHLQSNPQTLAFPSK